jgi:threonine dehydrogenase-like Zn-dependent dehydrogenase
MAFGPPLLLLLWAHIIHPSHSGWDWVAVIAAGLVGLAGAATAPWRGARKWVIVGLYALLLVPALPFTGLLAVCSTGDCL